MTSCIYIIANDSVLNWTIAWFASLESTGCKLPVLLIPYDSNVETTKSLFIDSGKARFYSREENGRAFETFSQVAAKVHPNTPKKHGHFLRYASFFGSCATFLYSDVDVVFFRDPTVLLESFETSGADIAHMGRAVCYKPDWRELMIERYDSDEFSSGFWAARRGSFTEAEFLEHAVPALSNDNPLDPHYADQPYFNYLVDMLGRRKLPFHNIVPEMALSCWPNPHQYRKLSKDSQGHVVWKAPLDPDNHGKHVWVLHWAGFKIGPFMPYRSIFDRYRFQKGGSEKLLFWTKLHIKDSPSYMLNRVTETIGRWRRRLLPPCSAG